MGKRMTIKEIRQLTNLSQSKFCKKYGIPLQTFQKWEQGHRSPPNYVVELLEFKVREDLKMWIDEMTFRLPCKEVYYVVDNHSEFAMVMSKSIKDLRICEIEDIDKKYYFSTKEKAGETLSYKK